MLAGRLRSSLQCLRCQRQIISSFVTSFDATTVAFPSARVPCHTIRGTKLCHGNPPRSFASTARQHEEQNDEEKSSEPTEADTETPQVEDEMPWYLKEQAEEVDAERASNPFAHRQVIPDLPPDPPPLLEHLLHHVSIDIGLDYLSILDLRNMDPPPALGANLIMLIGSARSEKHLNVSADRLCRWLRTEYKLTPYADGLLGRNELKLKLRRKARRDRMLGAVGAADHRNTDDGIRMGWICVNVGAVQDSPNRIRAVDTDPSFVGFGSGSSGVQIVVQMMTEEKRGEIDLEGLWAGMLNRSTSNDNDSQPEFGSDVSQETRRSSREALSGPTSPRPTAPRFQHLRRFHTSIPRSQDDSLKLTSKSLESELEPHIMPTRDISSSQSTKSIQAKKLIDSLLHDFKGQDEAVIQGQVLKRLTLYLRSQSPAKAIEALGKDEHDKTSTPFLEAFNTNFPSFTDAIHWAAAIDIHCLALELEHPGYTSDGLASVLADMAASAMPIPEAYFHKVIKAMLLPRINLPEQIDERVTHGLIRPPPVPNADTVAYTQMPLVHRHIQHVLRVIEHMENYGYAVQTEEIFLLLHRALSYARVPSDPSNGPPLSADQINMLQFQMRKAFAVLSDKPYSLHFTYVLLQTYADLHMWSGFWDVWRDMARSMVPRGPDFYALMFRGVARTRDQRRCQREMVVQLEEMGREAPPVSLEGDVAVAFAECMQAAKCDLNDPTFRRLWERCQKALEDMADDGEELDEPRSTLE